MSAEVGGQLETLPSRRSLYRADYWRIAVLLIVAAAVHGWLVANTAVTARDSLGYARIALNISDPNAGKEPGPPRQRMQIIRESIHPPGYPIVVWLTDKVLRKTCDLPVEERVLLATQLVNATAAVLLVVPLYLMGRILFGRNVGFGASLLFQVLPVPARVTSDGLSEGLYLLLVSVAVLFGVRAARRPTVGMFLLCGLMTGTSYLVRPEGLLVVVAVGAVVIVAGFFRYWPRDLALGRLIALGVGVALIAVPYMLLIGKITNKTTGDYLLKWESRIPPLFKGAPVDAKVDDGITTGPLFAEFWNPVKHAGQNRTLWAFTAVGKEIGKSLHYILVLFVLIGLIARRQQLFLPDFGFWIVIALGSLNLLLLIYLASRIGYISERHTILFVMLSCLIAASGIGPTTRAFQQIPALGRIIVYPPGAPATLLLILVASALPYTLKQLHANREGHKYVGRWLAQETRAGRMQAGDFLKDPLSWAEWYAGRTLYNPPRFHNRPNYVWVIWEHGKGSPHSRLPLWDEAGRLVQGLQPVYRWPENAPEEGPAVEVYKVPFEQAEPLSVAIMPDPPPAAPPPPSRP